MDSQSQVGADEDAAGIRRRGHESQPNRGAGQKTSAPDFGRARQRPLAAIANPEQSRGSEGVGFYPIALTFAAVAARQAPAERTASRVPESSH